MFDGFGPQQLMIVLVIVLIFFGNRIPEAMRGLGSGIKALKSGLREDPADEKSNE
jgi:sec-independent protein translocase protein TatA